VTAGLAGALWVGVSLIAPSLAGWLLDDAARAPLIRLIGAYAALKVVAGVPYMALRMEERAGWYVVGLVAEFTVLVGGVYYFLVVERMGLEGVLWGFVASAGTAAVLMGGGLLVLAPWRFRARLVRHLLAFGAPLTFAGLANVLLNTGDRFLLDAFDGAEAVAVYGLAQKFGGLVNMLFVQSFSMAFAVLGLKALGSLDAEKTQGEVGNLHRRTFRHFAALTGWGVLGVSLLTFDVTAWVSPNPAYLAADPLILPIALGFMGYGVYYIMMNVLYATAQTGRIAGNVLGAALFNLGLNAVLIPYLGAMGAALATLASYGALAAVTAWQARGAVVIAFPWHALVVVLALVVGLWALGQPALEWTQALRLGWRLALIAAYPLLVLATGVYTRDELRITWQAARTSFGGGEHEREHLPSQP
jgi:O-antigen/teichoic acid export membrane protein